MPLALLFGLLAVSALVVAKSGETREARAARAAQAAAARARNARRVSGSTPDGMPAPAPTVAPSNRSDPSGVAWSFFAPQAADVPSELAPIVDALRTMNPERVHDQALRQLGKGRPWQGLDDAARDMATPYVDPAWQAYFAGVSSENRARAMAQLRAAQIEATTERAELRPLHAIGTAALSFVPIAGPLLSVLAGAALSADEAAFQDRLQRERERLAVDLDNQDLVALLLAEQRSTAAWQAWNRSGGAMGLQTVQVVR